MIYDIYFIIMSIFSWAVAYNLNIFLLLFLCVNFFSRFFFYFIKYLIYHIKVILIFYLIYVYINPIIIFCYSLFK